MSDETSRPDEEEVEAHGPKPGDRTDRTASEDEEPDVEAHGPKPAGPTKNAMLSTPLTTALAAVNSSAVRARVGVRAACAERYGLVAIVAATATA